MKPVRRVLVVSPYGIGDLLFVTPILRALNLLPGIERVDLLLGSRTESVVRNNPHVTDILEVNKDHFHAQGGWQTLMDVLKLGLILRARRYDTLIDFSMRGEYAFGALAFLGIGRRIGFSYKRRGVFHNVRQSLSGGFEGKHVTDFFCDLVEQAGIPVEDRGLEFYPHERDRRMAAQTLEEKGLAAGKTYMVVSAGGGESWGKDADFKRWPPECFADLINRLSAKVSFDAVVIVGSSGERELSLRLEKNLNKPVINLCGDVSLPVSAALLEGAVFFLGNDGGLVHLAHARRVPLIALYGPVDARVYGPFPDSADAAAVFKKDLECRPCYRRFRYQSDCEHRDCLQALGAEEVFQELETSGFLRQLTERTALTR